MGNIVFNYTALTENLASKGYIVVGINPTYSSDFVVFSDASVAYKTPSASMPEGVATDKGLNGERGLQITNSYITAFFDKYVKNIDNDLLKEKQSYYSEVKIQLK